MLIQCICRTKQVKNTAALPPAIQQRGSAKPSNKNRFLAQNKGSLGNNTTRSMPTSPALTGVNSPSLAPTSAPLSQQQADKTRAIRRPIIHKLAIGPATEEVIRRYKQDGTTNAEFKIALEKVADFDSSKWTLKQRSFKELDVFSYEEYTLEERQTAIDNAVRVYDKLRLGASEPEWERLLPEEERGTGKTLSKLQAKIATGAIKPAKAPKIKLSGADESGRDTGVEDNDEGDLFGEKVSATPQSAEMTRSHSNPPITKPKKVSEKEAQAKRLLAKSGKAQTGRVTKSAAVKSEKKTQEKGFKSSKFVNDSDEEDDYLVNNPSPPAPTTTTTTTTTTTAKTIVVRKPLPKSVSKPARDESDAKPAPTNSKPKGNNTSPVKSSPLANTPPTNASDIEDSSSSSVPTTLKRKADSQSSSTSSSLPLAKRHQKSGSSSSSSDNSSITSSNGIGSGSRRSIGKDWAERTKIHQLTQKYNAYYPKYRQLYREMESEDGPRDPEKMADLFEMQQRLQNWKREILKGHGVGV
jgi:RNA polymerase II elongation factor ELL